ncbi:unnamed protein product [Ilex paraguariensis]|uniref:Uncharacterized protein n=1 Tax=Ilex paraguariensis TaxID=185542 RepID=A0ABC8S2R5_9AQUA
MANQNHGTSDVALSTLQDCKDALSLFREGTESTCKPAHITPAAQECMSKLLHDFETKMSDDLHTPTVVNASLQEASRLMNSSLNMLKFGGHVCPLNKDSPLRQFNKTSPVCQFNYNPSYLFNKNSLLCQFNEVSNVRQLIKNSRHLQTRIDGPWLCFGR